MALDKTKTFASFNESGIVDHYSTISYSHSIMEYSIDQSITNNQPEIGATYDAELNAFIPPKPKSKETYIFSTETYQWEPDPNLEYDIDGVDCRWSPKLQGWITVENWSDAEHA